MSMLRNLATSLINAREERIITTLPKAKELRPFVERAITLSRHARNATGDHAVAEAVHYRRQAAAFFHSGNFQHAATRGRRGGDGRAGERTGGVAALRRLFDVLGERYRDRPGGYTRIIKLGRRDGDNAELAVIELVDNPREREAAESTAKRAKTASPGKGKTAKVKAPRPAEAAQGGQTGPKPSEHGPATEASGGETPARETADNASGAGGRQAEKTEHTAGEQDTQK